MGLTHSSTGRGARALSSKPADKLPVVALAGSANVGKSTVFNALTGLDQHTGNWAGKTVAIASGRMKKRQLTLVDLPGCASLIPASEEEKTARDFILSNRADAIIVVADATNAEKSLALALMVLALAKRVLVCLNLSDEAEKAGINVDYKLLSKRLGVPVVPCAARSGVGLDRLLSELDGVLISPPNGERSEYLPFLSDDALGAQACFIKCKELIDGAVFTDEKKRGAVSLTERIDRVALGRYTALPIMFLMLMMVFYITIIGANYPSELLSKLFSRIEDGLFSLLTAMRVAPFLKNALVFGMFRTVSWVTAVMLPPMAIFFPLFTLLEDFGYLPRAAFCLDRVFSACSSCGKQALTISMGFGCNAAGVVGCRIIQGKNERLAAIVTNSLVPCNGRFPMLIALCSVFLVGKNGSPLLCAIELALFIVLSLAVSLGATKLISLTVFGGEKSPFLMELPPYRVPQFFRVIIRSMLDRTLHMLLRAICVAAPCGLIIYAGANIHTASGTVLSSFSAFLDPFARFFGLDGVILASFILGFPANEIVLPIMLMLYTGGSSISAAPNGSELFELLNQNGWTAFTAFSVMIFSLFHFPCSTTCITIKKETGSLFYTLIGIFYPAAIGLALLALIRIFHDILLLVL